MQHGDYEMVACQGFDVRSTDSAAAFQARRWPPGPSRAPLPSVLAPMCGVPMKFGSVKSAASTGGSDAKTSSAAPARRCSSERRLERRLVHDAASSGVDEKRRRLHAALSAPGVDQAARGRDRAAGGSSRCRIRSSSALERDRPDAGVAVEVVVGADVVRQHRRAECPGTAARPSARRRRSRAMPTTADDSWRPPAARQPPCSSVSRGERHDGAAEIDHQARSSARRPPAGSRRASSAPVTPWRRAASRSIMSRPTPYLLHQAQLRHRAKHRVGQHVEPGDGLRVCPRRNVDQLIAQRGRGSCR